MKVIVAGSRSFDDYELLSKSLDEYRIKNQIIQIVSGGAKGADSLGEKYAMSNGLNLITFLPSWDEHGKKAGFIRNIEMAEFGDSLIAFWDSKSKGTEHMINCMRDLDKPVQIVWFNIGTKEEGFHT